MSRVLLVDDSDGNRLTTSMLLEDEGFEVEVAASFQEGLERLVADGAAYDLVLLDQHLGDGTGTELLPTLRARMPAAKAILISGSLGDLERGGADFDARVAKGTGFPELLAAVQRLVAARST